MKMTTKQPKSNRRSLLLGAFLAMSISAWSFGGCQHQPVAFQAHNLDGCVSQGGAVSIAAGSLDVSIASGYILSFGLLNTLAITSDPGQFKPETNYIQVNEVKVWFEYPGTFSLNGGGAALYPESAPKVKRAYFRLNPTTPVDFSGAVAAGAAGGAASIQIAPSFFRTSIVPIETVALLGKATELKAAPGIFQIIAHVTITGTTGTGAVLSTQEVTYPITICSGCMDLREPNVLGCTATVEIGGAASTNAACLGQDGVCIAPDPNAVPPPAP